MTAFSQSLPYECAVTCGCDRTFHLPLGLLLSPGSEPAHACVRCGHITCTDVLWTHIHHNTFEPRGRREYAISDETRAWLDLWPRVLRGNDFEDYVFLPASLRCHDLSDFQLQSARAFSASSRLARGRRLREAGIPAPPPPANLPEQLKNYQTVWELDRELTPDRDRTFLLDHASPTYRLSSPLAVDALLRRSDLPEAFAEIFLRNGRDAAAAACVLVRDNPATLPLALPGLLVWFEKTVRQSGERLYDSRLSALLKFLADQKSAASQIVPALEAIKTAVSLTEYEFLRELIETLRVLKGEPPSPVSRKAWFFG